eukprot:gene17842-biopygen14433
MPAPRPRHPSQKIPYKPAPRPRHARATPAPVSCDRGGMTLPGVFAASTRSAARIQPGPEGRDDPPTRYFWRSGPGDRPGWAGPVAHTAYLYSGRLHTWPPKTHQQHKGMQVVRNGWGRVRDVFLRSLSCGVCPGCFHCRFFQDKVRWRGEC